MLTLSPDSILVYVFFLPELNILQPRQYSISSAPNGLFYRISVKKEAGTQHPDGLISNRLHDHVTEGDKVELSAPSGVFVLDQSQTPKVFISGGIGQTPLLSMMEALIKKDTPYIADLTWVHGCRNEQVHAFRDRLKEISLQQNIKQFLFYDEVSQQHETIRRGWVDLATIKHDIIAPDTDYYICGPTPFIQKHYTYLVTEGIDATRIHFEEFGPNSLQMN